MDQDEEDSERASIRAEMDAMRQEFSRSMHEMAAEMAQKQSASMADLSRMMAQMMALQQKGAVPDDVKSGAGRENFIDTSGFGGDL